MKNIGIIVVVLLVVIFITVQLGIVLTSKINENKKDIIKNNKNAILELFYNFPESKNIYYISKNLYSERDIGPTIYQIDILAELTNEGYNSFIEQVEFKDIQNFEMKINPNNLQYNWKAVKNFEVLKSKDIEDTSVTNIYIDDNNKTIYIIAFGGN